MVLFFVLFFLVIFAGIVFLIYIMGSFVINLVTAPQRKKQAEQFEKDFEIARKENDEITKKVFEVDFMEECIECIADALNCSQQINYLKEQNNDKIAEHKIYLWATDKTLELLFADEDSICRDTAKQIEGKYYRSLNYKHRNEFTFYVEKYGYKCFPHSNHLFTDENMKEKIFEDVRIKRTEYFAKKLDEKLNHDVYEHVKKMDEKPIKVLIDVTLWTVYEISYKHIGKEYKQWDI